MRLAQNLGGELLEEVGGEANLASQSPEAVVSTVINVFLSIAGVVLVVLLVYGGYLWLMARGNEDSVTKAKDTIRNAIYGLIIVLMAYAISIFVLRQIYGAVTGQ